jgi:hypothetical protein
MSHRGGSTEEENANSRCRGDGLVFPIAPARVLQMLVAGQSCGPEDVGLITIFRLKLRDRGSIGIVRPAVDGSLYKMTTSNHVDKEVAPIRGRNHHRSGSHPAAVQIAGTAPNPPPHQRCTRSGLTWAMTGGGLKLTILAWSCVSVGRHIHCTYTLYPCVHRQAE